MMGVVYRISVSLSQPPRIPIGSKANPVTKFCYNPLHPVTPQILVKSPYMSHSDMLSPLIEAGASCSRTLMDSVSTGYPRMPYGSRCVRLWVVSFAEHALGFVSYVQRGVHVPIVESTALRAHPFTYGQVFYFTVAVSARMA